MPEALLTSVTSFSITRVLDASPERVFDAWTQPAMLRQWFAPPTCSIVEVENDARAGGSYRIAMLQPDGDTYILRGKYVEVRRPERLSFTWAWDEDEGPGHESLVIVELAPRGSQTELVFTQERLASEESRDAHIEGWTGSLGNLSALLASK